MAYRFTFVSLVAAALLATAPAARARLVYVKRPGSDTPRVWVARNDGTHRHRIGTGTMPVISPDGKWIAWRDFAHHRVLLRKTKGHNIRRVARSVDIGDLAFSPDSSKLGIALRSRLAVHDTVAHETFTVAHGHVRGFSFSPDSAHLVYGTSGRSDAVDAPSDIYALGLGSDEKTRVTRDRQSLNPVWGPTGDIVFDRQVPRDGDAPKYNLYAIHPDGGSLRRITSLHIPPLLSGLVPLEVAADGSRLLAEFTGQDTSVGFAVDLASGDTHSLAKKLEHGFVAADLSADGRTVLGMTGGPDPSARHHVVTVRYRGGRPTRLVRKAAYPDWSR